MNLVISWLQSVRFRVIATTFLVGIAFLISAVFGYGKPLPAQAATLLTIDSTSYQVDRPEAGRGNGLIENSQDKIKSAADNVREKLNLDEPLPPSTKKFFNQVQDKVEDLVEPAQRPFEKTDVNVHREG